MFSGVLVVWFFVDFGDVFEYVEGDEVKIAFRGATLRRAFDVVEADFGCVKWWLLCMLFVVCVVVEFECVYGCVLMMEDWDVLDVLCVELSTRFGASVDCVDVEYVCVLVLGECEFFVINVIVGGVLV